ncbi:hypothetical protein [Arthrobacter sp. ZGTC131]|uniref:hypothetical protein n=1 Tax=Arthrobacter sp. ZGTC131 TaxID=2058898 RepID=UPI0015E2FBFD|nr:hypothetical protein [Arthrobacter sp. ZGTC131]
MCGPYRSPPTTSFWATTLASSFISLNRAADVAEVAATIRDTERAQAARMHMGTSLRSQANFDEYLAARSSDAKITFRQHLRAMGGQIEE